MQLDDQTQQFLKKLIVPSMIGAAGTGALSGYASSKLRRRGETPADRRRRVIRNAVIGAGLGGMATAAVPTGMRMIADPYTGAIGSGPTLMDHASNFTIKNAPLLATFIGGGHMMARHGDRLKGEAANTLRGYLGNTKLDVGGMTAKDVRTALQGSAQYSIGDPDRLFSIRENLYQTGAPATIKGTRDAMTSPFKIYDRAGNFIRQRDPAFQNIAEYRKAFRENLASKGLISKLVSKTVTDETDVLKKPIDKLINYMRSKNWQNPADFISKHRRPVDPSIIAEVYSKYIRPSINKNLTSVGRIPAVRWGAIGAGGLLAQNMWDKARGE